MISSSASLRLGNRERSLRKCTQEPGGRTPGPRSSSDFDRELLMWRVDDPSATWPQGSCEYRCLVVPGLGGERTGVDRLDSLFPPQVASISPGRSVNVRGPCWQRGYEPWAGGG